MYSLQNVDLKKEKRKKENSANIQFIGYLIVLILVSSFNTNVNDLFDRIVKQFDLPLLQNLTNSAKSENLPK